MKIDLNIRKDKGTMRTLKLLRETLWSLLSKTTFESLSVQMICEESLVPRCTFYNYFSDKEDLLEYTVDYLIEDVFDEVGELTYTYKSLELYLRSGFDLIEKHQEFIQKLMEVQGTGGTMYQFLRSRVMERSEDIFINCPHVENLKYPPELTARFCASTVELLLSEKLRAPAAVSFESARLFLSSAINYDALGMYQDYDNGAKEQVEKFRSRME